MADKKMEVALILSAYDKMTRVVNNATNNAIKSLNKIKQSSDAMAKSSFAFGRDAGGLAAGGALAAAGPIKAFADVEEAALSLKSVMMKDGGILNGKQFEDISKLAKNLGDKLPGNTKDFYEMFDTMIRNGIPAQNILNGVGKSAAYLAVALKLPYAEAGKMAAKLQEATGVVDNEMLGFMDTIARAANVGVESGEMQYAFARSAGALKLMKIQGLEASKSVSAVYAALIKTGASGETVGTGMSAVFNAFLNPKKMKELNDATGALGIKLDFVDKKSGEFKGVENMIAQFDKLKHLNTAQRAKIVQAFLGPGADANFMNILIDKGMEGHNVMINRMMEQADLNAKVESQLAGQKALWEAATGTFTNVLAMVGGLVNEDITNFLKTLNNDFLPALSSWIDRNKTLVKIMAYGVGIFTAVTGALSVFGFAAGAVFKSISVAASGAELFMGGIKKMQEGLFFLRFRMVYQVIPAMASFNATLIANPIGAVIAAIAIMIAVVTILVVKWKEITKWYKESSVWVKIMLFPLMLANSAIILLAYSIRKVIDNWPAIKNFFTGLPKLVSGLYEKFKLAGANIAKGIWEGIKSMANKPVEEISKITKAMREYLPFSPAKKGAFMDLHKVKIVETIAKAMRPAPLVQAMATATSSAAGSGGGASFGGSGSITINYSPVINGGGNIDSIKQALKDNVDYLMKMIEQKQATKNRTKF